jgi:hypothetical protein
MRVDAHRSQLFSRSALSSFPMLLDPFDFIRRPSSVLARLVDRGGCQ